MVYKDHGIKTYTTSEGFTLVEMIIVITIMMMLMGGAYFGISTYLNNARIQTAKTMLGKIRQSIETYQVETGEYPDSLKDLVERPKKDISSWVQQLPKIPNDPWGRPYVYRKTPDADRPYELYSHGPGGPRSKDKIKAHTL